MAEAGLSQRELAERMNEHSRALTGRAGTTDARYIRKLLDGTIRWPHARQRRSLEVVLDRSPVELGFIPPQQAAKPPRSSTTTPARKREQLPVMRREFLRVGSAAVVSVVLPDLPSERSISMSDVHEMGASLPLMHTLDDRYGGGAVAPLAVRSAQHIQAALGKTRLPERVETALYSLAGTYASTAGWFAYDAGEHDLARQHFDRALRLAVISRDSTLQAQTWNYMGHQARWLGQVNEALAMAMAGLASSVARRDPKIAALFHARMAQGHAEHGELGRVQRSLGQAADALARDDGRERPPWIDFFDAAELAGLGAMAYLTLGQYRRAEENALRALVTISGTYARNRIGYTVDLAEAQLGAREVDLACATAHEALDLEAWCGLCRCRSDGFDVRCPRQDGRDWIEVMCQARRRATVTALTHSGATTMTSALPTASRRQRRLRTARRGRRN
jgi:hypothetical protein